MADMDIVDDEMREIVRDYLKLANESPEKEAEVVEMLSCNLMAAGLVIMLAEYGVVMPTGAQEMVQLAAKAIAKCGATTPAGIIWMVGG